MHTLLKHKRIMVQLVFFSTIALGCAMVPAKAATLSLKAKVPFTFTAGSEQFHADTYVFVPSMGSAPGLTVQDPKANTHEMVVVKTVEKNEAKPMKPELVFDRIGGKDFLRQVWIEQKGYLIGKSSAETTLEKQNSEAHSYRIVGRYIQD